LFVPPSHIRLSNTLYFRVEVVVSIKPTSLGGSLSVLPGSIFLSVTIPLLLFDDSLPRTAVLDTLLMLVLYVSPTYSQLANGTTPPVGYRLSSKK